MNNFTPTQITFAVVVIALLAFCGCCGGCWGCRGERPPAVVEPRGENAAEPIAKPEQQPTGAEPVTDPEMKQVLIDAIKEGETKPTKPKTAVLSVGQWKNLQTRQKLLFAETMARKIHPEMSASDIEGRADNYIKFIDEMAMKKEEENSEVLGFIEFFETVDSARKKSR